MADAIKMTEPFKMADADPSKIKSANTSVGDECLKSSSALYAKLSKYNKK
ncbi:hypothetical protein POG22_08405 [Geitlerinema sp. CS-897]|nr:hypothetical protein [Geitlerinema sp. CS-897]